MPDLTINIPSDAIAEFCRRNHIRKLSLFGSVLTPRFGPDSDVDFLVEFEEGRVPGYLGLARMEIDLAAMIGRKADLRTPQEVSRFVRRELVDSAVPQYERT